MIPKPQSAVFSPAPRPEPPAPRPRLEAKRAGIVETAMRHCPDQGYHNGGIEDLASELNVAKGSIFQYFGSKAGLFHEVYKRAARSFAKYLDCPAPVREKDRK